MCVGGYQMFDEAFISLPFSVHLYIFLLIPYPSVEAVTMATFPVRLLCDMLRCPATGLDLRHLNMDLNISCVCGEKGKSVIKLAADKFRGGQQPGTKQLESRVQLFVS